MNLRRLASAGLLGLMGCHLVAGIDETLDPDEGGCSESTCRLVSPQCGCPAGQQCELGIDGTVRECGPAGTVPAGSPCTAPDACEPGSVCVGSDNPEGVVSLCRRFCNEHAECGDGLCRPLVGSPVKTCTQACDLATSQPCPTTTSCYIGGPPGADSPEFFSECFQAGSGKASAPCSKQTECAPTYFCYQGGGESSTTCHKWCTMETSCPTGACENVNFKVDGNLIPVVIQGAEYGSCPP